MHFWYNMLMHLDYGMTDVYILLIKQMLQCSRDKCFDYIPLNIWHCYVAMAGNLYNLYNAIRVYSKLGLLLGNKKMRIRWYPNNKKQDKKTCVVSGFLLSLPLTLKYAGSSYCIFCWNNIIASKLRIVFVFQFFIHTARLYGWKCPPVSSTDFHGPQRNEKYGHWQFLAVRYGILNI